MRRATSVTGRQLPDQLRGIGPSAEYGSPRITVAAGEVQGTVDDAHVRGHPQKTAGYGFAVVQRPQADLVEEPLAGRPVECGVAGQDPSSRGVGDEGVEKPGAVQCLFEDLLVPYCCSEQQGDALVGDVERDRLSCGPQTRLQRHGDAQVAEKLAQPGLTIAYPSLELDALGIVEDPEAEEVEQLGTPSPCRWSSSVMNDCTSRSSATIASTRSA